MVSCGARFVAYKKGGGTKFPQLKWVKKGGEKRIHYGTWGLDSQDSKGTWTLPKR